MHNICEDWSLVSDLYEIKAQEVNYKKTCKDFKDFFLYLVYDFLLRPCLVDGSVFFAAEMLPESDS